MAIITGGNIITRGVKMPGIGRPYPVSGVPTGAQLQAAGLIVGDLAQNVDTGFVYEYTEPATVPTATRIDTVA